MRYLITTLLIGTLLPMHAQNKFPTISGETANGKVVTLPTATGKKYTLIGLAYSQKASPMLEEWYEPAYLRFVAQHGLFAGEYDVDVFFVPVFVGLNRAAYEPSIKRFKQSASPETVDLVLFSKMDMEPLRGALELKDNDIPYFFILDRDGKIVHRTSGGYTHDKLEAMEDVLLD